MHNKRIISKKFLIIPCILSKWNGFIKKLE
nr:MAG TPA: hypothetical protein [Bacteriophage sp.]